MRIRTIKPEFWQSEKMAKASRQARMLFVGLWSMADDSGRTRAASRLLASTLFPYDTDAPDLIDGWLAELSAIGAIRLYVVDECHYLDIPKWRSHQKIDKPSPSKLPGFDESSRILDDSSRKIALDQGSGNREGKVPGSAPELPPAESLFDPQAMAQAKAIMAADSAPKPPLPMPAKSFTDFRPLHGRCFVGKDERADWESLYRTYGWDAMHAMHEELPEARIYLSVATTWLNTNYKV